MNEQKVRWAPPTGRTFYWTRLSGLAGAFHLCNDFKRASPSPGTVLNSRAPVLSGRKNM